MSVYVHIDDSYKPLGSGYVAKEDLDNKELDMLPIRNGCSGGACACSGYCKRIKGFIPREAWEKRQAIINLIEVLHDQTRITYEEDPERFKELKKNYETFGSSK